MAELGTGAGVAALGFWLFIAIIVAVGVWDKIRKRDAEHETLRRIVESGQPIDAELTDKLLALTSGSRDLDRDLKTSGLIILFLAPGLAAMGWIMSITLAEEVLGPLLGVSALLLFLSVGFLGASYVVKRWYSEEASVDRQHGT